MWNCSDILQPCVIGVVGYSRDDCVGGDYILHLLGPGVHETEPSASQRDKGTVFDLEFVTVGVDLLSHLQHCGHIRGKKKKKKT